MKFVAATIFWFLLSGIAGAQTPYTNWDVLIRAGTNSQTDSLARMGIRPDATADFENLYDIPRPPRSPSGTYLEVYFPHSGGAYPPILGSRYAVDFQGPADPVWNLSVECSTPSTITLHWDSSYVNAIEPRVQLFLVDLTTGAQVNMRVAGRYTFSYTSKRDFRIVGAIKVELTYLMEGFWNGATQVQDTVTGFLSSAAGPQPSVDTARVVLSPAGTGLLVFPSAPTGNYFLVIRHRNHLTLWSAAAGSAIKGTTSFSAYNFSTAAGSAFGSDALKNEAGVYVAWGGDVNQDGVVDFLDRNDTWNNRGLAGYRSSDCNGSNVTDGTDYSLVLANRLRIVQRP